MSEGTAPGGNVKATVSSGGGVERLRKAEVQDLHGAVIFNFDVGWLEIAVDDTGFVSRFQCLGDLLGDRQSFIDRDRALGYLLNEPFSVRLLPLVRPGRSRENGSAPR